MNYIVSILLINLSITNAYFDAIVFPGPYFEYHIPDEISNYWLNSLWKISSFTNNLEWDLSYFSFFRVALLSIVNAIIDCDPHQAEECHQTYERKCQRLYKNDCYQVTKEVEENYESQDCSDVEICDMDFNCYPLTECFTVTKTRIVNRPITKCNKVPYNDCRSVPKNVCENVWKSNCTEMEIVLVLIKVTLEESGFQTILQSMEDDTQSRITNLK